MASSSPTRVRSLLIGIWLVATAACEGPAEIGLPDGVSFLEEDSAGVLVATTLGARARTPVRWVVDTVPEYRIGELEGEEPYLFTSIASVQQLSDGRVVVLDRTSCELRFFSTDGIFLEHKGGRGEGPGEFHPDASLCVLVPSPGNDSLRAFDGSRLSFFGDHGRFSHRLRASWNGERVSRVHGVASDRVLVETRFFSMSREVGVSPEPSTSDFALLDLDSWEPVWEGFFQATRVYSIPGDTFWGLPFDIMPDAALGRDGLFLTLGENQGPEILEYDMSGRLRRVIRLAEPTLAPSVRDLKTLAEFRLDPYDMPDTTRERLAQARTRQYGEMPLPKIMPVFARLLVDEVGWLWAELYRFDVRQPVRWLVFGPNGEGLGSVDMPPDLDVRQIGGDFVLGVWEDEFGVEYVRRHALMGRR